MEYVEQDCTIQHEGKKFTSGGAVVTPDYIVGYVGKPIGDGMGCDRCGKTSRRYLTDWHGKVIGTCFISSTWRTPNSFTSSVMHQIYAKVDGVDYTGRGQGEGMIFKGKRCKSQD